MQQAAVTRLVCALRLATVAFALVMLSSSTSTADGGPVNTSAPTIAWNSSQTPGTTVEGQTINVNDSNIGTWAPSPTGNSSTPPFTYQWLEDCNASTPIVGETEPIYTLHSTDVGHTVCVAVTATNAAGSNTANSNTVGPVTAVTGAKTYYIAASGSDSNNGTSKGTPWLHAPGMVGCSANCAANTPQPGDEYILRGGDTWDDNGTQGVQGLLWHWIASGTLNGRIYVGVDRSWYSGNAWTRPLLSGDNPIPGPSEIHPSSCAIDDGGSFWNGSGSYHDGSYVTFDGFEMSGFCQVDLPYNSGCISSLTNPCPNATMVGQGIGDHWKFLNWYVHGWSDTGIFGGDIGTFQGWGQSNNPNDPDMEDETAYNIVDGSDSSKYSGGGEFGNCWNFNHNYISYTASGAVCSSHAVSDNTFTHVNEDQTTGLLPTDHGNTFEEGGGDAASLFYNNMVRDIAVDGNGGIGVNLWFAPWYTENVYNNVMYDVNVTNNYNDVASGTVNYFNNTFEANNQPWVDDGTGSNNPTTTDNHFIGTSSRVFLRSGGTSTNDLIQTPTEANSAGYTQSNGYAPTASTSPTQGTAANKTSQCATLPDLCRTTAGGVLEAPDHTIIAPAIYPRPRPSSGPWNQGAYTYP